MAMIKTPPSPSSTPVRRLWHAPAARTRWLWLLLAVFLSGSIGIWYLYARKTTRFLGPFTDPLRWFGIVAFLLVLATAAYSLRRRFLRGLPGMARDWLQMHIWLGMAALTIAFLHENFLSPSDCVDIHCITQYEAGTSALIALAVLVVSGIIGRLLDLWEARVIAREASSNRIGISRAVEEHLQELEYTVERLSAGKSPPFKHYCLMALQKASVPESLPTLPPMEGHDFQRAQATLRTYAQLMQSLHRQQRAKIIMRLWRSTHMALATLSLLVIAYHSLIELLKYVLHV
jgi:hypothetical protein